MKRTENKSTDLKIDSPYERIYAVIRKIPRGKVSTYGQVAALCGLKGHARQVGFALRRTPVSSDVPWQRVVNSQGRVSLRGGGIGSESLQEALLKKEGVKFKSSGKIDFDRHLWDPGPAEMTAPSIKNARKKSQI